MDFRVVTTAGDVYGIQREQWDDGNNVVALEPGVVIGYDRNTLTNTALRKAEWRSSPSMPASLAGAAAAAGA